jgi:hypothetical protein
MKTLKERKEEAFENFKHEPLSKLSVYGYFEFESDVNNYEDVRKKLEELRSIEGVTILSSSAEV